MSDALQTVKSELEPALERLVAVLEQEGEQKQRAFFVHVLDLVRACRDIEDLAAPMMELSASAFIGFQYSLSVQLLLDRVLASAQQAAMTLSADAENTN